MKKVFFFLLLVITIPCFSQNNFKIGIMSPMTYNWCTPKNGGIETNLIVNGKYTSILGILKEDGFNLTQDYTPDNVLTYKGYKDYAQLCQNNGFQIIDDLLKWYKPNTNSNQYGNICNDPIYAKDVDLDTLFKRVYQYYPNTFLGHNLGTEMYVDHTFAPYGACVPSTVNSDVPPQLSSDATAHFKMKCATTPGCESQKIIVSEAAHAGMIATNYVFPGTRPVIDHGYQPQDYINLQGVSSPTLGDIFTESSYFQSHFSLWDNSYANNTTFNYLGKFGSIEYARQNGYDNIFVENDISASESLSGEDIYNFQSNPSVPSANLMRFYAMTSFIHKAHGIIFYAYVAAYDTSDNLEKAKKDYVTSINPTHTDRFKRDYTPSKYDQFVSKFARELRYLVNNNYLSDDDSKVLYQKTTSFDGNFIVPASNTYLPQWITAADARDYIRVKGIYPPQPVFNTQRTEDHGLRYIIRTNGTEAVMIITNPNPYSVHNINLNFNNISNPQIANAKFIDVLFEDGGISDVNSYQYRTDTSSSVSKITFTLNRAYTFPFCNKYINADFGPFEVHVYHFNTTATPLVSYKNGWEQVWSNNGDGLIGDWGTQIFSGDKFVPFDFNGDGDEELLCAQNFNTSWFTILDYANNNWSFTPLYSNGGSGYIENAGVWTIGQGDRFIPGDFNGDGIKDELLCVQSANSGAKVAILKSMLVNGQYHFYLYWTNLSNGSFNFPNFAGWGINSADKYQVGDFNGDGKLNELLCVQGNGGWWAIMSFTGTNFYWYWGNGSGFLTSPAVWSIGANDEFLIEDYDGNGIHNDILCVNRTTGNSSVIYATAGTYTWQQRWTNGGNNIIGNWGPLQSDHAILTGDIDAVDSKAELMCIQRCYRCPWAMTEDFEDPTPVGHWANMWAYNPGYNNYLPSAFYIDTWKVNDWYASNVRYLFIKPQVNSKKHLLAFKDYGCNNSLISMFKTNNPNGNYKTDPNSAENNPTPPLEGSIIEASSILSENENTVLYPNPTTGKFTISLQSNSDEKFQVDILDVTGKIVFSSLTTSSAEINPGIIANGIYTVRATLKNTIKYARLVVQ